MADPFEEDAARREEERRRAAELQAQVAAEQAGQAPAPAPVQAPAPEPEPDWVPAPVPIEDPNQAAGGQPLLEDPGPFEAPHKRPPGGALTREQRDENRRASIDWHERRDAWDKQQRRLANEQGKQAGEPGDRKAREQGRLADQEERERRRIDNARRRGGLGPAPAKPEPGPGGLPGEMPEGALAKDLPPPPGEEEEGLGGERANGRQLAKQVVDVMRGMPNMPGDEKVARQNDEIIRLLLALHVKVDRIERSMLTLSVFGG